MLHGPAPRPGWEPYYEFKPSTSGPTSGYNGPKAAPLAKASGKKAKAGK